MSHGYAVALLTPDEAANVGAALETLLAPYEECREVPEYPTPCYCIGDTAKTAAAEEMCRVHGSHVAQRERYTAFLRPHFGGRDYYDLTTVEETDRWEALAREFWDPIHATRDAVFAAHPLKDAPEDACETCRGTGTYRTTRNPMARWDYYLIGGRWANELHGRSIAPVAEIDWTDEVIPRAFVTRTPAGWIEKGKLGWFGSSDDKVTRDDWRTMARRLLAEAAERGEIAVVLDYHI